MQLLKPYKSREKSVADLLNWAALVDDGVVMNKSGMLMAGYFYRGSDIASSTEEERNYITTRINAALSRMGNGWVTWHDAVRLPAPTYPGPERSYFPDPITKLIDEERRQQFMSEGAHFESEYAMVFCYTPPQRRETKFQELLWSNNHSEKTTVLDVVLQNFNKALSEIEDTLGSVIKLRRMSSYTVKDRYGNEHMQDELVNYLSFCLTGNLSPINVPPNGMYLDAYIGGQPLFVGDTPMIGDKYICCVAIEGFPQESYPNILDMMESLPIAYRWSTRFIYLDQHTAITELDKYRKKWKQKIYGFWAQTFKTNTGKINEDSLLMTKQAEAAINEAHSSMVTFGYYTPVIVLMHENRDFILENARNIVREIQRDGFACRIEDINTVEAWLGTLPGHVMPNIRRPLIHTLNQADLLPLSSIWAGLDTNPCPFYPPNSPPLAYTATTGATPFRLNTHVGDLGHTLVFGPPGTGKSTLICFLAAQFRRYKDATICAFDKGRSMWTLANACGGVHYDIDEQSKTIALAPLSSLESESDMSWAQEWLETCYELQSGKSVTPAQRTQIYRALKILRTENSSDERSLTDFSLTVQDAEVRDAINHYTINGALGYLLDGRNDSLKDSTFTVFEMEEIINLGEKNLIPILLYLFRRFEKSLKGQPALLSIDEAWVMLLHPVFREKIRMWLKELRKKNCIVILLTQNISDGAKSGIFDILLESCPTKILLPNSEADKSGIYELYQTVGLNSAQINIVKNAVKKRQYYYISTEGCRLFDLGLGDLTQAFVSVSDQKTVTELKKIKAEYQEEWPYAWLKRKEINYEKYQIN